MLGVADSEDVDNGLGFQAGFGFKLTKNFSFDLSYSSMNFSDSRKAGQDSAEIDVTFRGYEISLTGTF